MKYFLDQRKTMQWGIFLEKCLDVHAERHFHSKPPKGLENEEKREKVFITEQLWIRGTRYISQADHVILENFSRNVLSGQPSEKLPRWKFAIYKVYYVRGMPGKRIMLATLVVWRLAPRKNGVLLWENVCPECFSMGDQGLIK